jgi:hypothetical protein
MVMWIKVFYFFILFWDGKTREPSPHAVSFLHERIIRGGPGIILDILLL